VTMPTALAGVWGLFGGFAVEGLEMRAAYYRYGCWPWKVPRTDVKVAPEAGPLGYATAEIIRLLVGAGLAMAAVATGQVSGPLGAIGIGVAAPTIVGQLAKILPLTSAAETRLSSNPAPSVHLPALHSQPGPVGIHRQPTVRNDDAG
jgi:hypothetical protein